MAALLNSIAVAIFATLIAMALGVPAGYVLACFKFRRVKKPGPYHLVSFSKEFCHR